MAKMNWSCLAKTVGVLFLLVLVMAFPVFGYAADGEQESNEEIAEFLGRIPGLRIGTPFVPDLPTDFEPSTFIINMVAYEQRVLADDKFACIISYAYSGNSLVPAQNAKVTLTLSEEIRYIDFYDQDLNQLEVEVLTSPGDSTKVTFNLGSSIDSGSLGNIIAVAKFDSELLDPTDAPVCSAEIVADNAAKAATGDVAVEPIFNPADWMILTYKEYPSVTPPPGGEVTYGITLYGNSPNNGLDLEDVEIAVDYPLNATVVSSDGGAVDKTRRKIVWSLKKLLVDEVVEKSITLSYPTEHFTDDASGTTGKSNSAEIRASASAKVSGIDSVYKIEDTFEHVFDSLRVELGNPKYGSSFDKEEYCIDDIAKYTIFGIENKGNINFEYITVTYDVPEDLLLRFVETGKYNADVKLVLRYKTEGSEDWEDWAEVSTLSNSKLTTDSLGITGRITKVRWAFSEGNEKIRPGFTGRDSVSISSLVKGTFGEDLDVSARISAAAQTAVGAQTLAAETSGDMLKIRTVTPEGLSAQRKLIVEKAFSLIGKVEYFWGGKSVAIGWDDRWGKLQYNTIAKRYEPYGLDCSGYVEWVFANSGFAASTVINDLGVGTVYQWPNSYEISPEEMLPGDLAFKQSPNASGTNHVGVIVGRDNNGTLMVAHCSSTYNTVVVTPYAGTFYYMRRPYILPR